MSALAIIDAPPVGWVSGSAMSAAINCPASAVLPRILGTAFAATKIGSALHEHVRHRNLYGIQVAVEKLPELAHRFELDEDESSLFIARAKAFEWNPPRGSVAELPLCLFEDGRVGVVKGGKGVYELPPDALLPAQIDLFWAEPTPLYRDGGRVVCPPDSTLWVVDFKSGREDYVAPAERNAQALAGGVLASKYTGAKRCLAGIVYLRKGQGIWDIPDYPLDSEGLARVEALLRDAILEVRLQRQRHAAGLPLVYREGMHCNLCRARHGCPAHLATLKSWLSDLAPIEPGALNDSQVQRLAELAPALTRFAASAHQALRAHVEMSGAPIHLSDGRVWGPHSKAGTAYDPTIALEALSAELGDAELARAAIKTTITSASVERAIKLAHEKRGISRKKSEATRRFFARTKDLGGVRTYTKVQWGVHKPKPTLPPAAERLARIAALQGIPIEGDDDDADEE